MLAIQNSRKRVQVEKALADEGASTFAFRDVLGPDFTVERLPTVVTLFDKVRQDADNALSAGKGIWDRKRPFEASRDVKAVGERLPAEQTIPRLWRAIARTVAGFTAQECRNFFRHAGYVRT